MRNTTVSIRQRINGGFRAAKVSRREIDDVKALAKQTVDVLTDLVASEKEFLNRIENDGGTRVAVLSESIQKLMCTAHEVEARIVRYKRIITHHEELCAAFSEAINRNCQQVEDLMYAHQEHSQLVEELVEAVGTEETTREKIIGLLDQLERRFMVLYPPPEFSIFSMLNAQLRQKAYAEGEGDLDEALAHVASDGFRPMTKQ